MANPEFPDKKYRSLHDSEKFDNGAEDVKRLAALVKKQEIREQLTKNDLVFLYELDTPIEAVGPLGMKDPRIEELRETRDTNADLSILFDCAPEDIARSVSEISKRTKAYIGKLEPSMFDLLPRTVEYVYTEFPEGRIRFRTIELGTGISDGVSFKKTLEEQGMKMMNSYVVEMLERPDFKVVGKHENIELVEMSVATLGFKKGARYDKICKRAIELGLQLCPAEVGPQLRLQYQNQPKSETLHIAMRAIRVPYLGANILTVYGGLWLGLDDGTLAAKWGPGARIVFLRPREFPEGGEGG